MKKITLVALPVISALNSSAIDPAGSRADFDEGGVDIPTPILIIGLTLLQPLDASLREWLKMPMEKESLQVCFG